MGVKSKSRYRFEKQTLERERRARGATGRTLHKQLKKQESGSWIYFA